MSYLLKVLVFALFTMAYLVALAFIVGAMAYASVCHYPDVPGCRTNMLPVAFILVAGLAIYAGLFWSFRRSTKSDRQGYDS